MSKIGPWFSNTWWGKRSDRVNIAFVIAMLCFMLWKSF
jgi:hypothetical protein